MQQPKIKDLKPGDKFTMEFTINHNNKFVTKDGTVSMWGTDNISTLSRGHRFYNDDNITNVVLAPREPKVGDKFVWKGGSNSLKTIIFINKDTIFYSIDGQTGSLAYGHNKRSVFDDQGILL